MNSGTDMKMLWVVLAAMRKLLVYILLEITLVQGKVSFGDTTLPSTAILNFPPFLNYYNYNTNIFT